MVFKCNMGIVSLYIYSILPFNYINQSHKNNNFFPSEIETFIRNLNKYLILMKWFPLHGYCIYIVHNKCLLNENIRYSLYIIWKSLRVSKKLFYLWATPIRDVLDLIIKFIQDIVVRTFPFMIILGMTDQKDL